MYSFELVSIWINNYNLIHTFILGYMGVHVIEYWDITAPSFSVFSQFISKGENGLFVCLQEKLDTVEGQLIKYKKFNVVLMQSQGSMHNIRL